MTISTFKSYRSVVTAMTLAAIAVLGATNVLAKEQSVAARLQKLEDTEVIRALLERYIELNESRDYAGYSLLFAKDGEVVLRRGRATGPANIKALLDKNFGPGAAGAPARGSLHVLSNVKIDVTGDTGAATSRWTLISPGDDGRGRVSGMGRYEDKLVREDGVWKFKQRIVHRDIPVDAPSAAPAAK